MNFQEQVDKLSNASLLAESTPWQFQRYGEPGLFLNSPGISLTDVKHFLAELLGSSDLLKILAPQPLTYGRPCRSTVYISTRWR